MVVLRRVASIPPELPVGSEAEQTLFATYITCHFHMSSAAIWEKTLYFIFVRPELRSKESNFVFNFYLMRSKGSRRVQQYGSINDILWQLYIFGPIYAQISPNMSKRPPRSLNFQCLWRCFAQTNGILKRSQFSTQKLIIPHVC